MSAGVSGRVCKRCRSERECRWSAAAAAWVCPKCWIPDCPRCGEPLGGRYRHGGQLVCWQCTGIEPLPAHTPTDPAWITFRRRIIDTLVSFDRGRFMYVDADRFVAGCPVCVTGFVTVRFHGKTSRAEITCSLGCPDDELGRALALEPIA